MVEERAARGRGGGGAEKKTSISGGGGGGFAIHRCGDDGLADSAVFERCDGVDPTDVEAVGEALVWTRHSGGGQGGGGMDSATSSSA
jgi:hypothetical protein